ncbi:MAG: polysaccharide biosynthesis/export family protein [Planctomycetota bacterium]|jgi:protein involved in polysaccharide export with SLBB domain
MRWHAPILMVALAVLAGCQTGDDARVLQVLNQRGFGRPTQDANRQYYVGIGDQLSIGAPGTPEYNGQAESVRIDGTITLADVGELYVNGLSPDEVTEVVRQAYAKYVKDTSSMVVRVVGIKSKRYYISGLPPRRPTSRPMKGDELLVDVLITSNLDATLVDTDEILVIRGDPENPLVIVCDYDDIVEKGLTRDNIQIRENDIIYLTPSVIGWFTYGVEILISPLKPLQQLVFGANNIISISDSFGQGTVGYGNKKYGGGGGFGGGF